MNQEQLALLEASLNGDVISRSAVKALCAAYGDLSTKYVELCNSPSAGGGLYFEWRMLRDRLQQIRTISSA